MRRFVLSIATLLVSAVAAGAAFGATGVLPGHETPNEPGSVTLSFALSQPPAVPETRSNQQLLELWRGAGNAYGVPWEALGAINKIESNFGRSMGPSSAGALGWMQFMPSTWERWGTDADFDGVANPWDPEDAIYSAARYLAAAGANSDIERAILAYNHADWYVRDVLELATVFAGGGGFDPSLVAGGSLGIGPSAGGADAVFRIDDLEKRLTQARRAVNAAQRDVLEAERRLRDLDADVFEAEQRAGDPALSDADFQLLEGEVTHLVVEREQATAEVAAAQERLGEAVTRLDELRAFVDAQASQITSSHSATAGLGAPTFAGQYVFPVGGGPSVVSVGADHHDYPAADITAPEGSPLYALADGIVTEAYTAPTGRCGIGFHLRLADGTEFLYCHLSYLESHVVDGAALPAGTPVGLVGSTGNSTGPHLHLQYVPTSSGYPQHEAWFRSLAGVAFSWRGDPPPPAEPGDASEDASG